MEQQRDGGPAVGRRARHGSGRWRTGMHSVQLGGKAKRFKVLESFISPSAADLGLNLFMNIF